MMTTVLVIKSFGMEPSIYSTNGIFHLLILPLPGKKKKKNKKRSSTGAQPAEYKKRVELRFGFCSFHTTKGIGKITRRRRRTVR